MTMDARIFDSFSEEVLEALNFARCQRADGSFYGTAGQCRLGTPAGAKEVTPSKKKSGGITDAKTAKIAKLREAVKEAKKTGDTKKLKSLRHDLQINERMAKITAEATRTGRSFDDVARERNTRADAKIKARIAERYPNLRPNFSEKAFEILNFARCQRPDGSFYGTAGQCRLGTPAGAKEKPKSVRPLSKPKETASASKGGKGAFRGKTLDEFEAVKKEASKDSRTILGVVERGSGGESKLMPAVKSSIKRAEEQGGQAKINAENIKKLLKKRSDQGGVLDNYDRKELVGWMKALAYASNSQAKADFALAKKNIAQGS